MSAGIDSSYKVSGGLAQPMKQTAITDPRVAKLASSEGSTIGGDTAQGRTYTLGVGWGVKEFQIGVGLQAHDASKSTFSMTNANSPLYATATASLDVTWKPLRYSVFPTFLHAGPSYGVLVERTSGNYDTGKGLRFGGGLEVSLSMVTAFVDVYQMELSFATGPAQGMSAIKGATVGLGFNR